MPGANENSKELTAFFEERQTFVASKSKFITRRQITSANVEAGEVRLETVITKNTKFASS